MVSCHWTPHISIWQQCGVQKWKHKICHSHSWQGHFGAEFRCLGGMLIVLNTFDECQNDKSPSPFPTLLLCLPVPPFHTLTPLLLRPCFLFWDIWNHRIYPCSIKWVVEYSSAYYVAIGHPQYRQPELWDRACSQRKTDALCHVRNDRQKSAFTELAFIRVNVDGRGLFPSSQTVMELSSLRNQCLGAAVITFKLMNANLWGIGVAV